MKMMKREEYEALRQREMRAGRPPMNLRTAVGVNEDEYRRQFTSVDGRLVLVQLVRPLLSENKEETLCSVLNPATQLWEPCYDWPRELEPGGAIQSPGEEIGPGGYVEIPKEVEVDPDAEEEIIDTLKFEEMEREMLPDDALSDLSDSMQNDVDPE